MRSSARTKIAAERRFSVRLSLAKPERVQEVQYYVLGRDPVMVFRDEDYIRNINMDNGPKLEPSRSEDGKSRRIVPDGEAGLPDGVAEPWVRPVMRRMSRFTTVRHRQSREPAEANP